MAGLVGAAGTLLISVVRSKVTAVVLGPAGLGRASEVQQVLATALVPLGVITGPALVSTLARHRGSPEDQQRTLDAATSLLVLLGLVLGVAGVAISAFLLPTDWSPPAILLAALSAIHSVGLPLATLSLTALMAAGEVGPYARASALVSFLVASCTVLGTWQWGIGGQFAGAAVAPLVVWTILRRLRSTRMIVSRPRRWRWDPDFLRQCVFVGGTTLIGGFALQGALSAIRAALATHGGDAANGQFQAAWSIGVTYFGVILSGLGNVVFPRYAAAPDAASLEAEIDGALRLVLRGAPGVVLLAIGLREPVLHLLYDHRFDQAAQVLGFQMAGDVAKAAGWAVAGPLLYRGRARAFLITEAVGAGILAAASWWMVPRWGVVATGHAYVLTYLVYAPVSAWVTARACDVRIPGRLVGILVALSAGLWLVALFVSRMPDPRVGNSLLCLAGALWIIRAGVMGPVWQRIRRRLEFRVATPPG